MTEVVKLLKGIMKTSGWTQEQVADKLGVSFASLNAWVNGRTKPRKSMIERIRTLYMAQDITKDKVPTYITLVNADYELKVGDALLLVKDTENGHDDEAIKVTVMELDEIVSKKQKVSIVDDEGDGAEDAEDTENTEDDWEDIPIMDGIDMTSESIRVKNLNTECITRLDYPAPVCMYVANSVNSVARGTKSAGRIYDKFESQARAIVCFVFHKMAIARVVEWDYEE